jgi:hypothetical protein
MNKELREKIQKLEKESKTRGQMFFIRNTLELEMEYNKDDMLYELVRGIPNIPKTKYFAIFLGYLQNKKRGLKPSRKQQEFVIDRVCQNTNLFPHFKHAYEKVYGKECGDCGETPTNQ